MIRPVAGDLPEQVKNNQSVSTAAGNGGQKMSQYSWFTVYDQNIKCSKLIFIADLFLSLLDYQESQGNLNVNEAL